jgi:hypothetical protein
VTTVYTVDKNENLSQKMANWQKKAEFGDFFSDSQPENLAISEQSEALKLDEERKPREAERERN